MGEAGGLCRVSGTGRAALPVPLTRHDINTCSISRRARFAARLAIIPSR